MAMDTENSSKDMEDPPSYELRTRKIIKRSKTSNVAKSLKTPQMEWTTPEEMECENSQESVSMLQECYEKNDFPETCMDSELEVVDIYSEETETRSTQTDEPQLELSEEKEKEMAKHAQFISSVVKLKAALASREKISDKQLSTILQKGDELPGGTENDSQTVSKEAIGYVLRTADVENIFKETVQVLLQHLEDSLRNDFLKIAACWKNSVYETVVELLKEAVDSSEAGITKMVVDFLIRTIDSILEDEKSKNLTLESKTNFITVFCQSTHLCYNVNNFVIKKLKNLKQIKRPSESTIEEKLSWVYLTKNSCFLLRMLESSLEFLKSKLEGKRVEEVFTRKPPVKNYSVLEMWKKHWGGNEVLEEEVRGHEWESTVSEWCEELDEVLLHCVDHVPVLSLAVERCGELTKEILKICHPDLMEERDSCP